MHHQRRCSRIPTGRHAKSLVRDGMLATYSGLFLGNQGTKALVDSTYSR
jgi:hypothetical protein